LSATSSDRCTNPPRSRLPSQARLSAAITHDHPEGIKGAQVTALAVYLARTGADKVTIHACIQHQYDYALAGTVAALRSGYKFDVSCQGTVPAALIAFLDADCYTVTARNAVSLGGDSDTLACIAGSIAEAYYGGVPDAIQAEVRACQLSA
jgi:ADP-ribosylglycohydrolase